VTGSRLGYGAKKKEPRLVWEGTKINGGRLTHHAVLRENELRL